MSHVSRALEKYYSRQGKRIIFKNGQSLNQLAFAMWERLGCRQVDASVMSRVLKGERLFTAPQLRAFCAVLTIPEKEEAYLLACLQEDYAVRCNLPSGMACMSSSLAQEIIEDLTTNAFGMFYQGNYIALEKRYELVQELAKTYAISSRNKTIDEAIGLNLYIRGRTIANGALPGQILGKILPIFHRLIAMSRSSRSQLLYGYAHVLLSTTYYLAGGYSDAAGKHRFYAASIRHAKAAIDTLPEDDHERLFALRSIAASAGYTHNLDALGYVLKRTREAIPKQPKDNYINTLHLTMSLSKGLAANRMSNPLAIREYATSHFKRNLSNTGVYEVSAIKEEIDTLLYLRTQDKNYIRDRLEAGRYLAEEYQFSRQKKYFNKLLRTL